jgi:hypothetical protein
MTLDQILERLRLTAEDVTTGAADTRRPSWAPALIVVEEFIALARMVNILPDDDKPVVRLWANFADPRQKGTVLREQVGLALTGVRCRGFALYVGTKRRGPRLFYARRGEDGRWEAGPSGWSAGATHDESQLYYKRASLLRSISFMKQLIDESGGPDQQPNVAADCARAQSEYDQLNLKYQAAKIEREASNQQRARLLELARERVIEFGGGDNSTMMSQMTAGTRVTGTCCICGALLTDPISIEYGIGPICRTKQAPIINAWVARQVAAKTVTMQTGLPL